jgi:hypothetical protein
MIPNPTHAVVTLASLDLRRRPDHKSELRSQLLLGEVVRVLGRSGDRAWWRVENRSDGYRGWCRSWGLVGASARRAGSWKRKARARVVVSYAEATTEPGGGALVSPLFWNGRVIVGLERRGFRSVELPDGRRGWIPTRALANGRGPSMVERVRRLLGVPYLWGGRTAMALDCSGFTQQVMAEQGIAIPRDAFQQFRAARPLPAGESPRPGDLVFFGPRGRLPAHVGLVLGGGYFAHSRGRVRINSMDRDNPLWDSQLSAQMRGVRRPHRTPPNGLRRRVRDPESA